MTGHRAPRAARQHAADRGVHAGRERGRGRGAAPRPGRRCALPDPRAARPRADRGVRATSWPRSATACRPTSATVRPERLPAGPAPDRGQAGGEARLVPAAAHDEARALSRGEPRATSAWRPRCTPTSRARSGATRTWWCTARCGRCARARTGSARRCARRRCPRWGCTSRRWSGAAAEAERELIEWKKVRFMAGKLGEVFSGYVTGRAGVRAVRRARRGLRAGAGARLLDDRRLLPLRRARPPAEGREHGPRRTGSGTGSRCRSRASTSSAGRSTSPCATCSRAPPRAARGGAVPRPAAGRRGRPRGRPGRERLGRPGRPPARRTVNNDSWTCGCGVSRIGAPSPRRSFVETETVVTPGAPKPPARNSEVRIVALNLSAGADVPAEGDAAGVPLHHRRRAAGAPASCATSWSRAPSTRSADASC